MCAEKDSQVTDRNWVATQMMNWALKQQNYNIQDSDRATYRLHMDEKLHADFKLSIARTSFDLLRVASHCKNSVFSEEKEWRLALPRSKGKIGVSEPVQYRGLNGTIPYIGSNLIQPSGRLPITRVMLGPLCTMRNEVEKSLSNNGYAVPVIDSSIPLRTST
jgi:hypothetical protein